MASTPTSKTPVPPPAGPPTLPAAAATWTRADWAAIALLVGTIVALFWKPLFTSSMLYYRDIYNYTYPVADLIRESCRQGHLPYWNPYLNYGQPLLANPNFLFFYPYTALIILLPLKFAYTMFYVFHFAAAAAGTYLLARRWNQSRLAALLGASFFVFSGPILSLGNLYNHAACAAWIPWALLMTERVLSDQNVRAWLLLTLVFSLQFLAAEPFTMMATFGLCVAYAFFRRGTWRAWFSPTNLRILAGFFLAGCLMMALCAVQFLPASDFLQHARRGATGLAFKETSHWSFHPLSLIELVVPDFFGTMVTAPSAWTRVVGDDSDPYFISVFVGCIPFFFALAGWALSEEKRRNFIAGAAAVLGLISLGRFTPVFSLAYLLVPLLSLVRFPVKLLVLIVFLVALLAGWGFDALRLNAASLRNRSRRALLPLQVLLTLVAAVGILAWIAPRAIALPTERGLVGADHPAAEAAQMADYLLTAIRVNFPGLAGFVLGGIVCVLGLRLGKRWARPSVVVLAILGAACLLAENHSVNPTVPRNFYTFQPPVLSNFEGSPGTFRVVSLVRFKTPGDPNSDLQTYINFESISAAKGLPSVALHAFQDRLLLSTGSMLNGIEEGINIDVERSLPPYLYDLWFYLMYQAPGPYRSDLVLGRTNVKYIIQASPFDVPTRHLVKRIENGSPQPSYLYQDLYAMPRTYVAGSSIFTDTSLDTLRRMASADFDMQDHVILAAAPHSAPDVQGSGSVGNVEIAARPPNVVVLRAELSRPGYVVLLERYDPNWHATLDGREVPVLRADQLFRAVYAPAGQHEVRFFYHQRGLKAGLVISLSTLAVFGFLYWRDLRVRLL